MRLAEGVIEMAHEARQLELFARADVGLKAYSSVSKLVIRGWHRIREVRDVVEWEIERRDS